MTRRDSAAASSPAPGAPRPAPVAAALLRSAQIQDRHLARLAIVYVRQSSPQQVLEHRESRERQYALADQAVALGWPKDRILVGDEDQGQSARSADDRAGFQRRVAEVTMNHVGLVLGREVSRLARSDKDWHGLDELGALFQTLLADQDGVYDPGDPNDRLILRLKGMMSEVELITMRRQLERARYDVERAERQYQAVAPENRLVARTLERRWDEALQAEAAIKEDYDRFLHERPPVVSAADRERIGALAADIPALWQAPGTTAADRKEVVRCLVERVVVDVQRDNNQADVTVHWQGGFVTDYQVVVPSSGTTNSMTSTGSWAAWRGCGGRGTRPPRSRSS